MGIIIKINYKYKMESKDIDIVNIAREKGKPGFSDTW